MKTLARRQFLQGAATAFAGLHLRPLFADGEKPLRAVLVGHTGRGNYGHSLDRVFRDVPGVELAAVADPVEDGRAKAKATSGAARVYADWREMFEREKPELVCIASRWSEHRHEIGMAALG